MYLPSHNVLIAPVSISFLLFPIADASETVLARAVTDYHNPKEKNHLTFKQGDLLTVSFPTDHFLGGLLYSRSCINPESLIAFNGSGIMGEIPLPIPLQIFLSYDLNLFP